MPATNGFLYGTVFLAFARLFPDFTLYILFVLPIKIRWLATAAMDRVMRMRFLFGDWMTKSDGRGLGCELSAVLWQ